MSEQLTETIRLDLLGDRCPIPVQKIRKMISIKRSVDAKVPMKTKSKLIVFGDDPESLHDIPALLLRLGLNPPEIEETVSGWQYTIDL